MPTVQGVTRRQPRQRRSLRTVSFMFEAAARVIERDGIVAITTNRIADECGISVGSLYQYFPNKDALLIAMALRELAASADHVKAAINSARRSGGDVAEAAARALLASVGAQHKVRRELIEFCTKIGRWDVLQEPIREVEGLVAAPNGAGLDPLQAFVASSAVIGILRASLMRDGEWLDDDRLPREIAKLLHGYVDRPTVGNAGTPRAPSWSA